MHGWLEKMRGGERQVVFVTGEAGIGKTTLLDTFARSAASGGSLKIASGQCLEQYGTGEAYLPVLEAMRELCREDAEVIDVLRATPDVAAADAFARHPVGSRVVRPGGVRRDTRANAQGDERGVGCLDGGVAAGAVLEDLHWSDYSTLDLISYLARQRRTAQLMVIGTYRPAELIASGHPLRAVKQGLLAKHQCEELSLDYLSEDAVAQYLAVRFPANRFSAEVAALIHERTEGNPLFMVNTIEYLVTEKLIEEHEDRWQMTAGIDKVKFVVPDSVRHVIERQLDHLDAREQRILEAASVSGAEFRRPRSRLDWTTDRRRRAPLRGTEPWNQFIRDCVQVLPTGVARHTVRPSMKCPL